MTSPPTPLSEREIAEIRSHDVAFDFEWAALSREGMIRALTLLYADRATLLAHIHAGPTWRTINTVPLVPDEPLLLLSRIHGVVEAWYSPGYWSEETPDHPREYSGPAWVCGDDAFQIEIEEIGRDPANWHHGEAIGWLPRSVLPAPPADAPQCNRREGARRKPLPQNYYENDDAPLRREFGSDRRRNPADAPGSEGGT